MVEMFDIIKEHYKPIQPSVRVGDPKVLYREVEAERGIENFVHCFWQLRTHKKLQKPFIYRVVSDGCIDIFFNHSKPAENFIMGFCRKYTEFHIGSKFDYIGIRFLPSAFPLLFDVNAKALSDQSQELQAILPNLSQWIKRNVRCKMSFDKICELLTDKFYRIIQAKKFNLDFRFFNSLKLILQKKGHVDVEKELKTGLSPRQLRRIFNFYLGTTPKSFSNVVRFQHILNAHAHQKGQTENKIYLNLGFYDQAHFINSFKTFYGVTPSEAFR
jgi:AraC-like DNA-binding protein